MRDTGQSRVIGFLGVGFDTNDHKIRMTQSEQYQILMGSDETHNALQAICRQIDEAITSTGRTVSDFSPEEFMELVQKLY